jgi:predicted SAM-dependent methyltransferase
MHAVSSLDRRKIFGRSYFDGTLGEWGGYAYEGYRDFIQHWRTYELVKLRQPESVLELGCGPGFILKRLEDDYMPVMGIDVSPWVQHTKVIENIVEWDITETPWPVPDKSFDLCLSVAALEHIPEEDLPKVFAEMERTCARGLHGITFTRDPNDTDRTHELGTIRPYEWWRERLPPSHEVVDKELLETGPVTPPQGDGSLKLNIGCGVHMFHYGWVNIDVLPLEDFARANLYTYRRLDVRYGLPYNDRTVDMVFAHHFIEHLDYGEALEFLRECRRVLRPGGLIRIVTPDLEVLLRRYHENSLGFYDAVNEGCERAETQAWKLWSLVFSGHKSIYDYPTLKHLLEKAGFRSVEKTAFRRSRSLKMRRETYEFLSTLSMYVEAAT